MDALVRTICGRDGPEANVGPDKHQGANSSFLAVVKGGRWVRLTDPLTVLIEVRGGVTRRAGRGTREPATGGVRSVR